jgi:hypothetical protein
MGTVTIGSRSSSKVKLSLCEVMLNYKTNSVRRASE